MDMPTCPHSILGVRPLYIKDALPEPPMGIYPQESVAKSNEAGDVQNPIGSQIMQLQLVGVQQTPNKGMNRKGKPAREERLETYPFIRRRSRNLLTPWNPHCTFRHQAIVHQRAQIHGPKGGTLPSANHLGRL